MERIDNLKPGTIVVLDTGYDEPERAIFLGIDGEGDEREARFAQFLAGPGPARIQEWQAYRFNGRWAYGSGASALKLVDTLGELS